MVILICIKQHLSKNWSSIHEKLSTEDEMKKGVAYESNARNFVYPHLAYMVATQKKFALIILLLRF